MELAVKPLLRGYSHAVGTLLAVVATGALLRLTWGDPPRAISMLIYGLSMVILLGMSAVYHVFNWRPAVRVVLRRIDHADIFLFIAGTYTAIVFNAFTGWWRLGILSAVWLLSVVGIATVSPSVRLPRWGLTLLYVGIGWVGLAGLPEILHGLGPAALGLVLAGGVAYSLGAASYALKWPRLWPHVFGYHEVFHLMVLLATAAFFAVVVLYVVPYPRS